MLTRAVGKGIWGVKFSSDGKTLAIGTGHPLSTDHGPPDAEVWIYDIGRRERTCAPIPVGEARGTLPLQQGWFNALHEERRQEDARLWDTRTGKNLGRDLSGGLDTTDTAVSLDDRLVFQIDRLGRVTRRQIDSGKPLGEPWLLQGKGISRIEMNPDGRTLLTRAPDQSVRLWDIESGRLVGPPIEHESGCGLRDEPGRPDPRNSHRGRHDPVLGPTNRPAARFATTSHQGK